MCLVTNSRMRFKSGLISIFSFHCLVEKHILFESNAQNPFSLYCLMNLPNTFRYKSLISKHFLVAFPLCFFSLSLLTLHTPFLSRQQGGCFMNTYCIGGALYLAILFALELDPRKKNK